LDPNLIEPAIFLLETPLIFSNNPRDSFSLKGNTHQYRFRWEASNEYVYEKEAAI
jgi:hypothetical protein